MAERWTNAVVRFVLPLDVPEDASAEQKREAALDAFEQHFPDPPEDSVASIGFEDVEDGEPIA